MRSRCVSLCRVRWRIGTRGGEEQFVGFVVVWCKVAMGTHGAMRCDAMRWQRRKEVKEGAGGRMTVVI